MNDAGDQNSFDPRTWARPAQPAPAAASARPPRRTGLLAGAALALAVAGGAAYWLSGDEAQETATSPAPAAAAPQAEQRPEARRTRRTLVLSGAGDLRAALLANGLSAADADAAAAAALPGLNPHGEIRAALTFVEAAGQPQLERLEASNPDSSGAVVSRGTAGGYVASQVPAKLSSRVVVRRGTMDADSFYSSAVAAGITDSLIAPFAKALAFDFDFQREVRVGDAFEAAFEQEVNASGEPVGAPTLLYASLTTRDKAAAVYRFQPPGEEPDWFDGSGRSVVRALMRTPVDGARVSSKFGFRTHPILGYQKLHRGTDFAAPTGTPIYASGNAVVEFAAPKGANGNFVALRHDNGWRTLYLHMNRFAAGIAPGIRVAQGQLIGEVGTTGRSTGPHLHYEVHIDGAAVDPLSIQTDAGKTLSGAALIAFAKERDRIDVSRAREGE